MSGRTPLKEIPHRLQDSDGLKFLKRTCFDMFGKRTEMERDFHLCAFYCLCALLQQALFRKSAKISLSTGETSFQAGTVQPGKFRDL